jgi:manganese efflux pump family protein
MAIAALVTWLITAGGGLVMLAAWLARGGTRAPSSSVAVGAARSGAGAAGMPVHEPTRLKPPLVFGHVGIAVAGLVVWIAYLVTDDDRLAWTSFILLLPVALLGLTMFVRWVQAGDHRRDSSVGAARPESAFPLPVVIAHGVFAVTTVVLVLLTALGS